VISLCLLGYEFGTKKLCEYTTNYLNLTNLNLLSSSSNNMYRRNIVS